MTKTSNTPSSVTRSPVTRDVRGERLAIADEPTIVNEPAVVGTSPTRRRQLVNRRPARAKDTTGSAAEPDCHRPLIPARITKEEARVAKFVFSKAVTRWGLADMWLQYTDAVQRGVPERAKARMIGLGGRIPSFEQDFRRTLARQIKHLYTNRSDVHPKSAHARSQWWAHWLGGAETKWLPTPIGRRPRSPPVRVRREPPPSHTLTDRFIPSIGYVVPPGPLGTFVGHLSGTTTEGHEAAAKHGRGLLPSWMSALVDTRELRRD